jgi:hypothetical protein
VPSENEGQQNLEEIGTLKDVSFTYYHHPPLHRVNNEEANNNFHSC